MMVRLKDVAQRAGVSLRTVSNVVNDRPHVRPGTRAKVQAAIDEMNYRPNLSARQLKYGRGGFLALAIPQIDSPYFAQLAQQFTETCTEFGWLALMEITGGTHAQEQTVLSGINSHMVDGIIFSPLELTATDFAQRRDDTPLVLLGERAIPAGIDHVGVDSVEASRAVVAHLISTGRRRIAAIGQDGFAGTSRVRLEGYRQGLQTYGLPYDPELVVSGPDLEREAGRDAMERLLALPQRPDAVYCFNDLVAIGALFACHRAGVSVPDDIAVVGFDDMPETVFCEPPLTTISHDLQALTREAMRLVIGRIDGSRPPEAVEDVVIPWHLVVRGSA